MIDWIVAGKGDLDDRQPPCAVAPRDNLPGTEDRGVRRAHVDALLILMFGILHVADGILTYLGLSFCGLEEVNPVLTVSAEAIGLGKAITLFKTGELGVVTFLFNDRHKMQSRWITATLASAVGFYGWVVTNNLKLVFQV